MTAIGQPVCPAVLEQQQIMYQEGVRIVVQDRTQPLQACYRATSAKQGPLLELGPAPARDVLLGNIRLVGGRALVFHAPRVPLQASPV